MSRRRRRRDFAAEAEPPRPIDRPFPSEPRGSIPRVKPEP